jgi:glycosyltransferase involved in cell wall biosynthesis
MKVLHVAYNTWPDVTGGAIRTRYTVEAQRRLGLEPVVLSAPFQRAADPAQTSGVEYWNGIAYHRCYNGCDPSRFMAAHKSLWERAIKFAAFPAFVRRIRRLALDERVDIIHAHSLSFCGLAAAAAARGLGLPVVYEIRSLMEEGLDGAGVLVRGAYLLQDLLACRLASHVVVICKALREEMIRRGISPGKITIAGNGVDIQVHRPGLPSNRVSGKEFTIGYIGTLVPYEGLDLLIEAAALLTLKHPNLRLLIAGDGSARPALEEQARRLGLGLAVRFTGGVPHEEVAPLYREIDLFILPRRSLRLTDLVTPLKPLEIMAYAKPLLASDCGGHRELVAPGVNGVLFPAGSAGALARRIEELMADPESLIRLGRSAREWVSEHRSWESQGEPLLEAYKKLLARPSQASPKVLLVAPRPSALPTGGVETGVQMILRSALAKRYSIRLWRRQQYTFFPNWRALRAARRFADFIGFSAAVAFLRPDIVHIKSSSGVNFAESAIYVLISRALRRRALLQIHSGEFGHWYARGRTVSRWAIRCSLRAASEIIVLSTYWRDLLAQWVPDARIHVVPNGVRVPQIRPTSTSFRYGLRVLTLATLGSHKGHFDILSAAKLLRDEAVCFLLAGPDQTSGFGEGQEVRRRAAELRVEANVRFLGPVSSQEKWNLLADADIFLLPSRAEGMPNSVLEAMAAGLPVIATPVGALPEMLGYGCGGVLVSVGDFEGIARAVLDLGGDPGRREKMGNWNRSRVRAMYSFEHVERLLDGIYAARSRSVPARESREALDAVARNWPA